LDLGTEKWTTFASDPETQKNLPSPREYSSMSYDQKSKLILYGGWNNGWFDDLYTLNVAKIVGPSYAIISSDPALGQVSGNDELVIKGRGFQDQNIRVFFTCGEKPVDNPTKQTLDVPGVYVDETTITCITPNFEAFGPKGCVMQLQISGEDLTTTWIPFQFFLNTRANKSLAFGPGLLENVCAGEPVEFMIVARNDLNENRSSGRDKFEVKVQRELPVPEDKVDDPEYKPEFQEIEVEIKDTGDGTYACKYVVEEEG